MTEMLEVGGRLEATVDGYAFGYGKLGGLPLKDVYENTFGPRGNGWNVVTVGTPRNDWERLTHNMELPVLDIVVTPRGDSFAAGRAILQRL